MPVATSGGALRKRFPLTSNRRGQQNSIMVNVDWRSVDIYMMDFEGSPESGVVEYGVVHLREGEVIETTTALCQPEGPIGERDRQVHGLHGSQLEARKPFQEAYATFTSWRRQGVFAAHNQGAENLFLKRAWPMPPDVPDWEKEATLCRTWGPWIDTLNLYRAVYPGLDSYSLSDLVRIFDLGDSLGALARSNCPPERSKPHCALYDALASALLLLRLGKEEGFAGMTLAWLIEYSGRSTVYKQQILPPSDRDV